MASGSAPFNFIPRDPRIPRKKFVRPSVASVGKFASLLIVISALPTSASAATIRFGDTARELVISEVSARTVRLELLPLDASGFRPLNTPSQILVPFVSAEKLHLKELTGEKQVRVGDLRVAVHGDPLTVTVRTAAGKLVQEVAFLRTNDAEVVTFRIDAPVLGLGAGEEQYNSSGEFDRRGHFYRMVNGQLSPMLATHGTTIPVPFLIGTDGWRCSSIGPGANSICAATAAVISYRRPLPVPSRSICLLSVRRNPPMRSPNLLTSPGSRSCRPNG